MITLYRCLKIPLDKNIFMKSFKKSKDLSLQVLLVSNICVLFHAESVTCPSF